MFRRTSRPRAPSSAPRRMAGSNRRNTRARNRRIRRRSPKSRRPPPTHWEPDSPPPPTPPEAPRQRSWSMDDVSYRPPAGTGTPKAAALVPAASNADDRDALNRISAHSSPRFGKSRLRSTLAGAFSTPRLGVRPNKPETREITSLSNRRRRRAPQPSVPAPRPAGLEMLSLIHI